MSTLTLTILCNPLNTAESWKLIWQNSHIPLEYEHQYSLQQKSQVEGMVWWVSPHMLSTFNQVTAEMVLLDLATEYSLQLTADANAEEKLAPIGCSLMNQVELKLSMTTRTANKLLQALGLAPATPEKSNPVKDKKVQSSLDGDMSFEARFRFWLASAGITGADADKVCQNQRIASCIRDKDGGDLVRELYSALCRLGDVGRPATARINDPGEQLLLLTYLSK